MGRLDIAIPHLAPSRSRFKRWFIPSLGSPIIFRQTEWIDSLDMVKRVLPDIDAAFKPDRVFRYESPTTRVTLYRYRS